MADIPSEISSEISSKFSISENTFSREIQADPQDRIEIELGDSKQLDFKPQFKFMRWDNEVNFSIRAQEHAQAVVEIEGEIIKYITPDYEIHQYDKPDAGEDGGLVFEWVLLKKPGSNFLTATIEGEGIEFWLQVGLTEEEKLRQPSQNPLVEGSYAVMYSAKVGKTVHALGKNYKTAKLFHMYRATATDSLGNSVLCDYNTDLEQTRLLTITIPQAFLDTANYPVKVK